MEIKNVNVSSVNGATPPKRPTTTPAPATDDTSFTSSAALEGALKNVPDSRPEAVARARELINNPNYPPLVLIQKLSRLFAINTDSEDK